MKKFVAVMSVLFALLSVPAQAQTTNARPTTLGRAVRLIPTIAPASPDEGSVYQSSVDHNFYIYNGTSWVAVGTVAGGTCTTSVVTAISATGVPTCTASPSVTSIKAGDGLVTTPAITFASDPTTGFWKAGTSNWSLVSNVLRFDNSTYLNGFSGTYYGLSKLNDWGSDRGGLEVRGMQNNASSKVHNSAIDLNGFTATGTGFPAISINGGQALNGGLTYLAATDSIVRVCNEQGSTPCDVNIIDVFGAGKVVHQVLDIPNSSHGFGTTSTIGYSLNNGFPASAVDVSEWSPAFAWCGTARKTNATAATETDCWKSENRTLTGAAATTSTWALASSLNAGAYADKLIITSAGVMSGPTYQTSGSGMAVANVGANSCGTSTATIAGNNNAGEVTVGATSGTQCRITFTVTAPTKWQCTASDESTAVLVRGVPVDTTHADLVGVFTAADVVTYICFPR